MNVAHSPACFGRGVKVIVNPAAGDGCARRAWPALRPHLEACVGPYALAWTSGPEQAEVLTRAALRRGVGRIIAVGGDGTLSGVVNGFFENGRAVNAEASLAFLTCGTGGDFRRTVGAPRDLRAAARRLACPRTRRIDVGRLTYVSHAGREETRYFLNIASFGMGGLVDEIVRAMPGRKLLGGTASFFYAIVRAMVRYRNQPVALRVDGTPHGPFVVRAVAVANGRFFGGGIEVAPRAALDDGLLDVVVVGNFSRTELLMRAPHFYRGTHEALEKVMAVRGRRVTATALGDGPVLLDVDGEPLGRLPATFEVVPQALRLAC